MNNSGNVKFPLHRGNGQITTRSLSGPHLLRAIPSDWRTTPPTNSISGKTFITPMNKLEQIQSEQNRTDLTPFEVGDTVKVHTRVIEGGKERIQIFAGIVLGIKGAGAGKSFTVRKLSYGEGVERVFPFNTPRIASVEIVKRGRVRRAKLNYLRQRIGKEAVQVKELVTR